MPDTVSMSKPNNTMVEGAKYSFDCNVTNVAPLMNFSFNWIIGDSLTHRNFFFEDVRTPVDKSATFEYEANRDHNGTQILCEAKLNFYPGPYVPTMRSNSYELIVHCELFNIFLI